MKKQMGNAAIYFNPIDYKNISKKIDLILNNKKLRKKLISNGKKKIVKYNIIHFSRLLEKYIKKTLN
jgi:glycosyltransferase involved in cell wall biosynthesis